MESKQGNITICVKQANLIHDTELMGKMDPYVVIKMGKIEQATTVKDEAGKQPKWNETFEFSAKNGDRMEIAVWDKETTISDDLVGTTEYIINTDLLQTKQILCLPIFFGKKNENGGEVLLEMQWTEQEKNPLFGILESRKEELAAVKAREIILKEEVVVLNEKIKKTTDDYNHLKVSWQEEKELIVKSQQEESNSLANESALIKQITELKDKIRNLELEKLSLNKIVDVNNQKINELVSKEKTVLAEISSLREKIRSLTTPQTKKNYPHSGVVTALMIFGVFVVGSRF